MSTHASRLRSAMVIAQVTCCIVLLADATLLLASVSNIYRGPGFNPDGVLLLRLRPSLVAQDPARAEHYQREVIQRLERLPGVVAASPATYPPLPGWGNQLPMSLPGSTDVSNRTAYRTSVNAVGPSYLRTIELSLVAGRDFSEQDRKDTPRVAIVNEVVARAFWPAGSALGSEFVLDGRFYRVVGIVKAAQYRTSAEPPEPLVLVNYWQTDAVGRDPIDSRTHVRVAGNAARMLPTVKREILNIDPTVPISEDRPLTEWLGYFFRPVRATAAAVACFATLALLLSAVGLYAVIAANVAQRTREIALRMALGADRRNVGALILGQGIRLTAIGVGIGVGGTLAAGRLLAAYLYGVRTHDPVAIGGAVVVLTATALIASYLPARRAMGLDPIVELRN